MLFLKIVSTVLTFVIKISRHTVVDLYPSLKYERHRSVEPEGQSNDVPVGATDVAMYYPTVNVERSRHHLLPPLAHPHPHPSAVALA